MNDQEILEALNKSEAIPPVLCMSERSVTFVEYADGHGEAKTQVNNWFRCPRCNGIVGERRFVHKRIIDQRTKQFCEKCGQKMEWGQEKSEPKKLVTVSTPGTEYAVMAKRVKDEEYDEIYISVYEKEDAEGLKADELREVLLTVKGIGPAKTENIVEAVEKALSEKVKH